MDAKFFFTEYPEWIDFNNEEFIVCGDNKFLNFERFANGFIVLTQYHPVALATVKRIVDNIQARYYPEEDMLDISGPLSTTRSMVDSNMMPFP